MAGITINEVPKIHVSLPTEEHHPIVFQETNFQIPLSLNGTFSYFTTSKQSIKDLEEPDDVYALTPTIWNAHSETYVIHEESMLDWEGYMRNERNNGKTVVLENIPSDETMISSLVLCEKEEELISSNFVNDQDEDTSTVQGFEDEMQLYQDMKLRTEHGQFAMNVGTTSILDQVYLDDDDSQGSNDDEENLIDDPEDDFELMELEDDKNEALLDNLMASTAQVGKSRGVDSKHLSMIWRISHEDAKKTIDVTTQASV